MPKRGKRLKKRVKRSVRKTSNKIVKRNLIILLVCFLIVYIVAFLGSLFTSNGVNGSWYSSIKNSLTPPNWVFPIVWNILFFMISLSLYFSWIGAKKKKEKIRLAWIFGINLLLNFFWTVLFFAFRQTKIAFFELVLLWVSILFMIFITWKTSEKSSWLLLPYAIWIIFAGILNYFIAFGFP